MLMLCLMFYAWAMVWSLAILLVFTSACRHQKASCHTSCEICHNPSEFYEYYLAYTNNVIIKTHSHVSVAKKATYVHFYRNYYAAVFNPSYLYNYWVNIYKINIFMPFIYTTLHPKYEGNQRSSSWDMCFWKLPDFLHIFFFAPF